MVHIRRISLGYPGNWEYQRISADEMISGGHRRMGLYPDIGFYSIEKIAANATLKILYKYTDCRVAHTYIRILTEEVGLLKKVFTRN